MSRNIWADYPLIYGVANRIQVVQGVVDGQDMPVERGTIPFYQDRGNLVGPGGRIDRSERGGPRCQSRREVELFDRTG